MPVKQLPVKDKALRQRTHNLAPSTPAQIGNPATQEPSTEQLAHVGEALFKGCIIGSLSATVCSFAAETQSQKVPLTLFAICSTANVAFIAARKVNRSPLNSQLIALSFVTAIATTACIIFSINGFYQLAKASDDNLHFLTGTFGIGMGHIIADALKQKEIAPWTLALVTFVAILADPPFGTGLTLRVGTTAANHMYPGLWLPKTEQHNSNIPAAQ